jgi:hypothetical protein
MLCYFYVNLGAHIYSLLKVWVTTRTSSLTAPGRAGRTTRSTSSEGNGKFYVVFIACGTWESRENYKEHLE